MDEGVFGSQMVAEPLHLHGHQLVGSIQWADQTFNQGLPQFRGRGAGARRVNVGERAQIEYIPDARGQREEPAGAVIELEEPLRHQIDDIVGHLLGFYLAQIPNPGVPTRIETK